MVDAADADAHVELVDKLIAQGLALTPETDVLRVHGIIRILLSICVVSPLAEPLTPDARTKALSTLRIIRDQVSERHDLLRSVSEKDSPAPFYKHVLPQLILAAERCEALEGYDDMQEELVRVAAHVLACAGKDMDSAAAEPRGRVQLAAAVLALKTFVQAALQTCPAALYDLKDLTPSPVSALIVIRIVVRARVALIDDTLAMLAGAMNALSTVKDVQLLFIRTLTAIIPHVSGLDPSLCAVLRSDADSSELLRALPDDAVARAWWEIYSRRADELRPYEVTFLLTPRPRISYQAITKLLAEELAGWRESDQADIRHATTALQATPKKRKRDDAGDLLVGIIETHGDVLADMLSASDDHAGSLRAVFPKVIIRLCDCESGHSLPLLAFDGWRKLSPTDNTILSLVAQHVQPALINSLRDMVILKRVLADIRKEDKRTRLTAMRALVSIVSTSFRHPDPAERGVLLACVLPTLRTLIGSALHVRASVVHLLGSLSAVAPEELYGEMLELLMQQLGAPHMAIRSLAFAELTELCRARKTNPYLLIAPHMERISILIGLSLNEASDLVAEAVRFMRTSRQDFVGIAKGYIIPALVVRKRIEELRIMSSLRKESLGAMLCDEIAPVLSRVFRQPRCQHILDFLLGCMRTDRAEVTLKTIVTMSHVRMAIELVVDLGDVNVVVQRQAERALLQAAATFMGSASATIADLLQPHMLGIITGLNEALHDMQGRKTGEYKRKIIRCLCALIDTMGDSMATISPQLVASLQSTLAVAELRTETLATWLVFIKRLRYADSGPFIGRTTAALVARWGEFNERDRALAIEIVNEIADNTTSLAPYLGEVVDMSHIPALKTASAKLIEGRQKWSFPRLIEHLLDRMSNRNAAVSATALRELKAALKRRDAATMRMVQGDSFDPLATRLVRGLLSTAQEEDESVRALSYECLGLVGAPDPDRLVRMPEPSSMILLSNFTDKDESAEFAIHLIRDLLVDAYKATYDIKHQTHLAYAIQELLAFCEFNAKMLQRDMANAPQKVRMRWARFPGYQHETLTPLLEGRFKITEAPLREYQMPVYLFSETYREWVQNWSMALLSKVIANKAMAPNSNKIFGVLRGVLRNQDVSVANHILPHLVLHVLLSSDRSSREEISLEINTVLQDQVNPVGPPAKRTLSAQVIFDLMDHLSKWLREARAKFNERDTRISERDTKVVDVVLSSVDTELLANAALKSKAYARSLRNFEQRVIHLRYNGRPDSELQTYYERLHEIYADLDEPDGMEGVSVSVMSPSLEHQIREHESTGRWTSAQSCWEVRLQQSPDDVSLHEGLLRCLRNLGHYDTLRTHIRGVSSRQPGWIEASEPFAAEAAWIIGDWAELGRHRNNPMAQVMLALHEDNKVAETFRTARMAIGAKINSHQYSRVHDSVLSLHILHELESIYKASKPTDAVRNAGNMAAVMQTRAGDLRRRLADRFDMTAPAFRVREAVLSARRTAFSVVGFEPLQGEIGKAWILSSKMARKEGYEQTAYSASLQAKVVDAPFAFIQQAKLLRAQGGTLRALMDLHNALEPLIEAAKNDTSPMNEERFTRERNLSKATLLAARWQHDSERFHHNLIIKRFKEAITLSQSLESPYYHIGHYFDQQTAKPDADRAALNWQTCHNYMLALQHGNKYIFRTMPRALTLWLDLAEVKETKEAAKKSNVSAHVDKISAAMDKARMAGQIMPYQYLTALPQMTSRLGHRVPRVRQILVKIVGLIIGHYPHQALWTMFGLMQSRRPERKAQAAEVMQRVVVTTSLSRLIDDAERFSANLLRLANADVASKVTEVSLSADYPFMKAAFPTEMILPLQDSLTAALPSSADNMKTHVPYAPGSAITIKYIEDKVDIMQSMQKPKKLVFVGGDGRRYPFLCKPHDDLRKDARLMDFNAMINKLLKSASESRRRQLYIRTYAVMPLNEECGLIEWVNNTLPLKSILEQGYARYNKKLYNRELHNILDNGKRGGASKQVSVFQEQILPQFRPTVFHEWFLNTWPEPSAWLAARMAYARTLAVMSMIGFVLGLGDRHGENILFDSLTGDTLHVDLNCLFDKGKTFEIPEKVPFRLTHNMIDAMGVTGVEGVFRKAAEITFGILRTNSESLMSVLEAFVHDPLVEWESKGTKSKSADALRERADKHLTPIRKKLLGLVAEGVVATVPNHVEMLIQHATAPGNLAVMYQGWAPWL